MNEGSPVNLVDSALFQGLDRRAVERVLTLSAARHLTNGMTLIKQGDQPEHLFMVLHGRLKITALARDGGQKTIRFMGPGDVVGCAAVFRRMAYPATASAVIVTTVLSWTMKQLDELLREHPQIAANALSIVSSRTTEMLQRLREVTSDTVQQRIAIALIRLVKQADIEKSADAEVLRISRQDLAELSDASLFTVSRTISAWSRLGILKGGRQKITLLDLDRLEGIAIASSSSG